LPEWNFVEMRRPDPGNEKAVNWVAADIWREEKDALVALGARGKHDVFEAVAPLARAMMDGHFE
jgi:hypothetical protein